MNVSPELGYLASAQDSDGGWGSAAGQPPSELYSAWAALGLAAAGRPESVRRDGHTVLEALRALAGTLEGPGDLERHDARAARLRRHPRDLARPAKTCSATAALPCSDGSFGHHGRPPSVRGLRPARARVLRRRPARARRGRVDRAPAGSDGGFDFAARRLQRVDDTAAALQGLLDAGVRGGAAMPARSRSSYTPRTPTAAIPAACPAGASNAQSTAWAVQGLRRGRSST